MNQEIAEKLNKKSLLRFHAKLTKFLKESKIDPQNDDLSDSKLEKVLSLVAQLQNQLKVQNT